MPGRIVQFGTSRFLQPHVDLFVHEARAEGQDVGPISVVKTTSDTIRNDRICSEEVVQGFAACGTHVSGEPWRVLAVSALDGDRFLVSARYTAGDIRTYRLHITEPGERDEFLKAEQALKKGENHGRPGAAVACRPRRRR